MPQVDVDKRVLLSGVKTLTFFLDGFTLGRRTRPIPQMTCSGKLCKLYQPSSVMCNNIGGRGSNVQWKCESDLPSSIRFGKLDINCEGWERTGDPFVLEGSCALKYELIKLHTSVREDGYAASWIGFNFRTLLIIALTLLMVYLFLSRYSERFSSMSSYRGTSGGGSSNYPPPPPYSSSSPPPPKPHQPSSGWNPGFWSGLGLGGAGGYLWGNRSGANQRNNFYDWERPGSTSGWRDNDQGSSSAFRTRFPSSSEGMWSGSRSRNTNRGEGSSNLGSTRTAYGLAQTSSR